MSDFLSRTFNRRAILVFLIASASNGHLPEDSSRAIIRSGVTRRDTVLPAYIFSTTLAPPLPSELPFIINGFAFGGRIDAYRNSGDTAARLSKAKGKSFISEVRIRRS